MRLFLIIGLLPSILLAETFEWFEKQIDNHEMVQMLDSKARAMNEMGQAQGSWGDPMVKISANNFPKSSLRKDETPMTGIQYGISQKFSMTTKYGNIEKSYAALSESIQMEKEQRKRVFKAELWKQAINLRKIEEDLTIMNENLRWVEKMIKVSKKLYSNGKLAQQGLLEIQIRKNNIETKIIEIESKKKEIESLLGYIAGIEENKSLDLKSIPWSQLETQKKDLNDYQEKKFKEELKASEYNLKSARLNYVPDLTVGIAYTKRSNIDNKGDFVGASISFPLPFSGKKYAHSSNAVHQKTAKERALRNYRLKKRSKLLELSYQKERFIKELNILKNKTLNFAKSARDVTSRSYRLGNASYVELLNAEINFQNFLLKKTELESKLDKLKIEEALLSGGEI